MHFRPHRGLLSDAMAEAVQVDGVAGLARYLRTSPDDLHINPYSGDDDRIGWKNVHIVMDGFGPVGFCAMLDGSPPR